MKIAGKMKQKQIEKRLERLKKIEAQNKEKFKQIEEESHSIKRVFEAEEEVRKTFMQLNEQLEKLNRLNAFHNREAVDIEDYCDDCLYSQEKFNKDYKMWREINRKEFLKKHPEFAKQDEQPNDEQED